MSSTGPRGRGTGRWRSPWRPRCRRRGVNAKRARDFARAMGKAAGTDAADARAPAAMGAALEPRRVRPPSRTRRSLAELRTSRDALVKDRTAAPSRGPRTRHPPPRRQINQRLAWIDRRIKALDAEAAKLIADDEAPARQAEALMSMPGVARITAAGLLAGMPELGRPDAGAAAGLAGLAPVTRGSGQWRGRGFIRGGRARPRRLLHMAAVAAIRHNPNPGRRLRGRGLRTDAGDHELRDRANGAELLEGLAVAGVGHVVDPHRFARRSGPGAAPPAPRPVVEEAMQP